MQESVMKDDANVNINIVNDTNSNQSHWELVILSTSPSPIHLY